MGDWAFLITVYILRLTYSQLLLQFGLSMHTRSLARAAKETELNSAQFVFYTSPFLIMNLFDAVLEVLLRLTIG
jgi:hypothetical protein